MRVIIRKDNTVREIEGKHTVGNILRLLDINPEAVLVLKDGKPVTRDVVVGGDEEIEILPVMSGG